MSEQKNQNSKQKNKKALNDYAKYSALGFQMVAIIVIAVFGGIEINIPKDWNVKIEGTPLFGGYSMNHKRPFVENAPTVVFKGLALFGGVEIE
jgi:hypothetical protein